METENTELDGVLKIRPPTNFEDFRGCYVEIYNKNLFAQKNIHLEFVQDDISVSRQNVLRGIHGDKKTWKLVSCLFGSFYLVVINNIPDSAQYGKWQGFTLSDKNRFQILIPPGFGNGHLVLTKEAVFHYKQTSEYDRSSQFTILYNDPDKKIFWPTSNPIISPRDSGWK